MLFCLLTCKFDTCVYNFNKYEMSVDPMQIHKRRRLNRNFKPPQKNFNTFNLLNSESKLSSDASL